MKTRFPSLFLASSGALLLAVAVAKAASAMGSAKVLDVADPLLGVSNRTVMAMAAAVEFAVFGTILLCRRQAWIPCLLVSTLGSQFLLYRMAFTLGHYSRGCPCLGTLGESLPFSADTLSALLWLVALWFCAGGARAYQLSIDAAGASSAESAIEARACQLRGGAQAPESAGATTSWRAISKRE